MRIKPMGLIGRLPSLTVGLLTRRKVAVQSDASENTTSSTKTHSSPSRSFFISYAHADVDGQTLLAHLRDGLRRAGHSVFVDEDIPFGARWDEEIPRQLAVCDFLLVLLSATSAQSEMVTEEVRQARDHHCVQGKPRLLPIRVNYDGALGYRLSAWLNAYEWRIWRAAADSESLLQQVLALAANPAALPTTSSRAVAMPSPAPAPFAPPAPLASPVPGGAAETDDPFYIEREIDAQVLARAAARGETLTIEAPRQLGKSSLLRRYLTACQQAGQRVALLDFSLLAEADFQSCDELLRGLAAELAHELQLDADPPPAGVTPQKFTHWLEDRLLARLDGPAVVAFDEVDRIFERDYRQDFFRMLRSWRNRRAPVWRALSLALVISTERNLLIEDVRSSPFNVGLHAPLPPFTLEQCRALDQRHRARGGPAIRCCLNCCRRANTATCSARARWASRR